MKILKIISGVAVVLLLVVLSVYLYWFRVLSFERHYLENSELAAPINLRALADARGFYLGASIDSKQALNSSELINTFNSATSTNGMKMGALLKSPQTGEYDFSAADTFLQAAAEKQLRVRGHTLVWGRLSDDYGEPNLQAWLDQFASDERRRTKLQVFMYQHIERVLSHFKGQITQWDVVNEPLELLGDGELDDNVYTRYIGEEYVEKALRHAHKIDPGLKLYINEQLHNYTGKKAQALLKYIASLQDKGVPLHGVGLQHHMLFHLESIESTRAYIQALSKMGLEVEISELDTRLRLFKDEYDPYDAQGAYYGALVEMCMSLDNCKGVTFWGLSDKQSWHDELGYVFPKPNEPYLFDAGNRAKPGVKYIKQALLTR